MEQSDYVEFKKQVGEALLSQASQFDKAILTLAGGALALSLTFIKEIAPTPDALTIGLLAGAWACFIASICVTLASFQVSICAHRRLDEILNVQQSKPDTDVGNLKNRWGDFTFALNLTSLTVFIVGTVLLSWSAYHGLKMKEGNVSDKTTRLAEGAVPISPPVASMPSSPPPTMPPTPGTGAVPASPPVSAPRPAPPPAPRPPTKK